MRSSIGFSHGGLEGGLGDNWSLRQSDETSRHTTHFLQHPSTCTRTHTLTHTHPCTHTRAHKESRWSWEGDAPRYPCHGLCP